VRLNGVVVAAFGDGAALSDSFAAFLNGQPVGVGDGDIIGDMFGGRMIGC